MKPLSSGPDIPAKIGRFAYIWSEIHAVRSRGGTPYINLYGEAPPERGAFFKLQVYRRVGISQLRYVKG